MSSAFLDSFVHKDIKHNGPLVHVFGNRACGPGVYAYFLAFAALTSLPLAHILDATS